MRCPIDSGVWMSGVVLLSHRGHLEITSLLVPAILHVRADLQIRTFLRIRLDVHREHGCRGGELVNDLRVGVAAAVKSVAALLDRTTVCQTANH